MGITPSSSDSLRVLGRGRARKPWRNPSRFIPVSILRCSGFERPPAFRDGREHVLERGRSARAGVEIVGREVVLEHAVEVADAERPKTRIGTEHAVAAKDDRLLDVGAGEDRRAGALERGATSARAVAVGVGLNDGDDLRGSGPEIGDGLSGIGGQGSGVGDRERKAEIAEKLLSIAARSTRATVGRIISGCW